MQVDVSVNPGMSGAPLLNLNGDIVGLVSSRVEAVNGRNITDVALAIPVGVLQTSLPGLTTGYREESLGNRPAVTTDTAAGAMQEFLRLLRVGEAATAYHWLSPQAQQALPEPDYLAKLGYAGSTSLLGGAVRVVAENGAQVTVSADVLVSRPVNGAVQSQWQKIGRAHV